MRSPSLRSWLARAAAPVLAFLALAACGPSGPPVRVVVPPGASFGAAADSLASRGIVRSARVFRLYASLTRRDRAIKPGTYELRRGEGWGTLLDALTQGRGLVHTFTIPEGFSLAQIVPLVARTLEVPEDSVVAAVADTAIRHQLDVPTPTLEGYLFPATYTFPAGTSARTAVRALVQRFERAWQPAWDAELQRLALSRHDAVTLASIVEKEARLPEERPVIAAVYYNRLKKGMLLQADPTVQYALGRHVARVLYKDLDVESAYNTYKHPGLPPGPIASPGAASLAAAVHPASVPFLYFVAHPDGHHEFRRTFAEHTEAIQQIRRERTSVRPPGGSPARPSSR